MRVVDYVANPGGGVRFAVEMSRALLAVAEVRLEIASHGAALDRYLELFARDQEVRFKRLAPARLWRSRTLMKGIPGAGPLNWLLGTPRFHFQVPEAAFDGCDLVWLPWIHRHRIPWRFSDRAVGSLHDVIAIDFKGVLPQSQIDDERETVRQWLASAARIAVSANATVSRLTALFGTPAGRFSVVPLSGQHARPPAARVPPSWTFAQRPYLLAPINVTLHKNHEVLLAGVGAWKEKCPLVLAGSGTDLWVSEIPRSRQLARLAEGAGLRPGDSVFGLGYVDDGTYYALLDGAWALVMPTLAEGGGSFPVWEAMLQGIPVVCSDIPAMREMVGLVGGRVMWFDPRSPQDLAARLGELSRDYARIKAEAVAQVPAFTRRSWQEVGADYARIMRAPLKQAPSREQRGG